LVDEPDSATPAPVEPEDSRRKDYRASVVLQLQYRNAGHLLVSYCTNLSRGGLFVQSTEPLPPGSPLTLTLQIPGEDEPVALEAVVRWSRSFDADEGPAGMGVSFDDVDDVLGERIDDIVASFNPLQVALVGGREAVRDHVAAQVRSLVTCETKSFESPPAASELAGLDLVVVDLDSDADGGMILLDDLHAIEGAPPCVALCDPNEQRRWSRGVRRARMVPTPVDAEALRRSVLEAVTQVGASEAEPTESEA
jgi:uncharacterized protein (TIGR02266 family)